MHRSADAPERWPYESLRSTKAVLQRAKLAPRRTKPAPNRAKPAPTHKRKRERTNEEVDEMPGKRATVKDEERYEKLRQKGESKEKAARIANTPRKEAAKRGGSSPSHDEWTKSDLEARAREIGIEGRSKMNKKELINALRNH